MAATVSARPLGTPDLVIRPFASNDLDAAHTALDLDQDELGMTLAEREAMTEYRIRQLELDEGIGCYAIVERSTDRLIGYVGLQFHLLPGPGFATPELELFYKLAKSSRGRGYATQACQSMLNYAFDDLRLRRTVSVTERDNVPSTSLLRRLGARIVDHPNRPELVLGIIDSPRQPSGG